MLLLFVVLKQTQKWLLPRSTEKLVSGGLLQGFIWYLPSKLEEGVCLPAAQGSHAQTLF